jgi:hypothetical protein
MSKLAERGIPTGTCLMPILPGISDDDQTLSDIVRWTAAHGGSFVLCGGLTLADQQRDYFFNVLSERFPDLLDHYQRLYPPSSYGPAGWKRNEIALKVRGYCQEHGIRDRIPRPVIPGEKRALNKCVVEALADRIYEMEMHGEPAAKVWAYRKAAWAVEDLEQDIALVYGTMGLKGLESIPDVGPRMGREVEQILNHLSEHPAFPSESNERLKWPES